MFNLPAVKVLPALHRVSAEPSSLSQEFSPVGMDMWDQNETFQDLSGLIEEEKCQTPASTPSPLHYVVPSEDVHQRSNHSQSWDQPSPAGTGKRGPTRHRPARPVPLIVDQSVPSPPKGLGPPKGSEPKGT
uniref:Uncharacterized protein n=1 Tax=Ixodes ricinus TaxID=34613 RepID=V5H3C4_IXORI